MNEIHVDHTLLFRALRERRAERGRVGDLLHRCELQARRNERCLDGLREAIRRVGTYLRSAEVESEGHEHTVRRFYPRDLLNLRQKDYLALHGHGAGQAGAEAGGRDRPDTGGDAGFGGGTSD
jgi:hypothetical protein